MHQVGQMHFPNERVPGQIVRFEWDLDLLRRIGLAAPLSVIGSQIASRSKTSFEKIVPEQAYQAGHLLAAEFAYLRK